MGLAPLRDAPDDSDELWPSVRRSLYSAGDDWTQTAGLSFGRGQAYPRIRGFRVAAQLLAAYVRDHGVAADGLIFPYLWSWRQHIELALKEVIVGAELLSGEDGKAPHGHDLMVLWQRLRKSIESHANEEELENVQFTISELQKIDPVAEAFRYATKSDGAPTLTEVEALSFQKVGAALAAVANFLDIADTAISAELDARA